MSGSAEPAPHGGETRVLVVPEGEGGERLDAFVARSTGLSRTRVQRLIEGERVRLDGRLPRKSESLAAGQRVEVHVPAPEPVEIVPEDLGVPVVWEDEALLVGRDADVIDSHAPASINRLPSVSGSDFLSSNWVM